MEGTYRRAKLMGVGGPWMIEEVPFPALGPGQVLIKMLSASICNQTDLNTVRGIHPPHDHQFNGMTPPDMRVWTHRENDPMRDVYPEHMYDLEPYPCTMGHEGAGVIVEIGPEIPHPYEPDTIQDGFKVGDRVAVFHLVGGLGEYVVAQKRYLVPVPESLSDEEAGLMEPMSVMYTAVRKSMHMGDTVCILGCGALGLSGVQYCRIAGAAKIIVSEPDAQKRALALKLGADYAIDPAAQSVVKEVERLTGGVGCDVVYECAGIADTIRMLPYLARRFGLLIQIGAGGQTVPVDWDLIHFKMLRVEGMHYASGDFMENFARTLEQIALGKLDVKTLITHRYKLEDVEQAFRDIADGKVIKGVFSFD